MSPVSHGAAELEALVLDLARRRDHRSVICLVERWPDGLPAARTVRLAHARSFLALRQMDLAWEQLRSLTAEFPTDIEIWALTGHLFVQRGWPERARSVVERIRELDPGLHGLEALEEAVSDPPNIVPSRADEIAASGSFEERLDLVERWLSVGEIIGARRVLDALAQSDPDSSRVGELVWATEGDFSGGIGDFTDFVRRLRETSEGEPTERVRLPSVDVEPPTAELTHSGRRQTPTGAMPSLFQALGQVEPVQGAYDEDETQQAELARLDELTGSADEPTQGGEELEPGDTEVLEVIGRVPDSELETAPVALRDPELRGGRDVDLTQEVTGSEEDGVVERVPPRPLVPPAEPLIRKEPMEVVENYPKPHLRNPVPAQTTEEVMTDFRTRQGPSTQTLLIAVAGVVFVASFVAAVGWGLLRLVGLA